MCDHLFGFHAHYGLWTPRTHWHCSTFGRASSSSIDCCAHSDFYRSRHHGFLYGILGRLRSTCSRAWFRVHIRGRVRPAPNIGSLAAVENQPDRFEIADTVTD